MSLVSLDIFKTEKIYAARVLYVCPANISQVMSVDEDTRRRYRYLRLSSSSFSLSLSLSSFLSVGLGGEKEQEYQFPSQEDILSL